MLQWNSKYVGPRYCRVEMYADGTDTQTDGRTPNRYIMLSTRRGQCNKLEMLDMFPKWGLPSPQN